MSLSYLAGEITGYIVITYLIYWVIKKLVIYKTKEQITSNQKAIIIVASIFVQFFLILQSVLRRGM